ncbi:hypothetical protein HMP0721_2151 [Pseudoramibacter alactolyticus ATCC 23263]|uniref:Uncharacterized protein n=1 Tax=Pseudoramibacter alactolyticus ATCC 23263 TaxID=887929 RepID=E6MJG6_9FIRM|nr:hypothetical protein HMP0721_2151 [Pseudoramibacter alactolyticus ATCC 23263]
MEGKKVDLSDVKSAHIDLKRMFVSEGIDILRFWKNVGFMSLKSLNFKNVGKKVDDLLWMVLTLQSKNKTICLDAHHLLMKGI